MIMKLQVLSNSNEKKSKFIWFNSYQTRMITDDNKKEKKKQKRTGGPMIFIWVIQKLQFQRTACKNGNE